MTARVIPLPFDSGIFGFPCGRLDLGDAPVSSRRLDELMREARALGIQHLVVRFPSEWVDVRGELESRGFGFMVDSLSLEKLLGRSDRAGHDGEARETDADVKVYEGDRDERLVEITARAFNTNTRFHLEPAFSPADVERLHRRWIRNLIADEKVQIFVHRDGGNVTGYVTLATEEASRCGRVGLVAVDRGCRRRGIGNALLGTLASAVRGRLDTIKVMTEVINTPALRLYARAGYTIRQSWTVLHSHRLENAGESTC